LSSLSASEGLSQLFHLQLELLSTESDIDADALLGKPVTVAVETAAGDPRYFNGIVYRFAQGGRDDRFYHYRAELVPWLWFLTQTSDCRVFQRKKIPDIIKQIFGEYGFNDFEAQLSGRYIECDYCVQYRETDFNFLSRLMEHEGIFYFFKHAPGKHTLVLADSPQAFQPCPVQSKAHYQNKGDAQDDARDCITALDQNQQIQPGRYTLREYHFQKPDSR